MSKNSTLLKKLPQICLIKNVDSVSLRKKTVSYGESKNIMFTFSGTNLSDQGIGIKCVVQKPDLRVPSVPLLLSNT